MNERSGSDAADVTSESDGPESAFNVLGLSVPQNPEPQPERFADYFVLAGRGQIAEDIDLSLCLEPKDITFEPAMLSRWPPEDDVELPLPDILPHLFPEGVHLR